MPTARDVYDVLAALKAEYGWGWAVSLALAIVFVIAFSAFYKWKYQPLVRAISGKLPFNPWSLLMGVDFVNLMGLTNTDPMVTFRLIIENTSGRTIHLTGIKGEVGCTMLFGSVSSESGAGLVPSKLENEVTLRSAGPWSLTFTQVFSTALAKKMIDTLGEDRNAVVFDFSRVKLTGKADRSEIVVPVARVSCWVKSPLLFNEQDQGSMHLIQPGGLISQTWYDIYATPRLNEEDRDQ
jgi:hypothetical protein